MQNWDDLRIFHAMIGARSVREAANRLGTTHATVSRRIRSLEAELGHTLFERTRTGYELTSFAQAVADLTDVVGDNIAAIDRLAFAQEGGLAGNVRLSVLEDLFLSVLDEPLSAFMKQHPLVDLVVDTAATLSDLGRLEADVVVRITRDPPEQAFGRKVADSPLAAYASPDYLADRPEIDRWIALDYPPAISPQLQARPVLRCNSIGAVVRMLERGQGIGLLPCFAGDKSEGLIRVSEIPQVPDMEIWVLTHDDVRKNPRVRALMDHLYEAFKETRGLIEGTSAAAG
ncbi:LysR family transcriptional regulator [uncultured Litoreibacter sp.]|uniref:LysR family transcriptional regulator n=1 Tax=uncultured Litoreibacter sp. TaxID=1392394 RepID=UPI00263297CD|nr:LysR family transcriptional regulator [uncultured Litoreibacter sp.]